MTGILGLKLGMTRLVSEEGKMIPVTLVKCEDNVIMQVINDEKNGYSAVQVGTKENGKKKCKKYAFVREFPGSDSAEKGTRFGVEVLNDVKSVTITGVSKGKGFAGTIKRYNFARMPETHGHQYQRHLGSTGGMCTASKVIKGKKMPGRMGTDIVTVKKVDVVKVDTDMGIVALKGALPGSNGTLVKMIIE